jgi:hypothetical protein
MSPEETTPDMTEDEPGFADLEDDEFEVDLVTETLVGTAVGNLEADIVDATGCAFARASTSDLGVGASAIGLAEVHGDAWARFSAVALAYAEGDITLSTSYTSALVAGDVVEMRTSLAPLVAGKEVSLNSSAACIAAGGEVSVENGWVGIVISPRATIGEGSRVLITPRVGLLIGALLFGGLGLVALAIYLGARRLAEWRPTVSLPTFSLGRHNRA